MPVHPYTFLFGSQLRFMLGLDPEDRAQRDVLAHTSKGQMYEHETSLLFVRAVRPGDTVVDVGGNAGYFSILAAMLAGPGGTVVTAEANPRLAALIRGNADLNGARQVRVEEVAISDRLGEIVFGSNGDRDSNGGVVTDKVPGDELIVNQTLTQFVARCEPLDSLAERCGLERIRLLKIDTEGHENHVLRGAERLLSAGRIDVIACELNLPGLAQHGTDEDVLRKTALRYGYHSFLLDHDGQMPRLVPPGTRIEQTYTCNILLARLDRVAEIWPTIINQSAAIRISSQLEAERCNPRVEAVDAGRPPR